MRTFFIPLSKQSHNIYYLNLLRIITLVYHMYIEYELYNLAYIKHTGFICESQFIEGTMSKWDYHYILVKIIRIQDKNYM